MKPAYPPIIKLTERIMLQLEIAIHGFTRYHKYTLGTNLHQQAIHVYRLAHKAWRNKAQQLDWLSQLV